MNNPSLQPTPSLGNKEAVLRAPGRVLLIIIVLFVLLGPPVGSLIVCLGFVLVMALEGMDVFSAMQGGIALFFLGLPIAYLMGSAQSLVIGSTMAAWVYKKQEAPLWPLLIVAIVCFLLWYGRSEDAGYIMTMAVLFGHFIATLVCWRLARCMLSPVQVNKRAAGK